MEKDFYIIDEKLKIRPIDMSDTDNIVAWRNNERVRNNFLYREVFTPQGHEKWMKTKVAQGEVRQFIIGVISDGQVRDIGSVYFRDIDLETGTAEYGIFIGDDKAIGHGYGNLVAKWAVDYARDEMHLKTLILRVLGDNTAALRSYENAGFVKYEVFDDYIDGRSLVMMKIEF